MPSSRVAIPTPSGISAPTSKATYPVRIFLPDAEGVAIVDEQGHLCRQSCCRWSTSRAFAVHRLCEVCCYYKELRTHRSLNNDAPIYRAIQHVGCIVSAPVLGGLHHQYCRI